MKIKKHQAYKCLKFFYQTPGKKNVFQILYELIIISIYWKSIPYQYFQFSMFLKTSRLTISEMKNHISNRTFAQIRGVSPYDIICNDKALFSDLMNYYNIPHPKVLFKYNAGVFYNFKNEILGDQVVDQIIKSCVCNKIFAKYTMGVCGANIKVYEKNHNFFSRENDNLSALHIKSVFTDDFYIFQEGIEQHEILSNLNSDSVNTIRILTKNNNGKISIIGAVLRMGRKGSMVDNASSGGIAVGIDINSGNLLGKARAYYDYNEYIKHPDSGVIFEGLKIPLWIEIVELAIRASQTIFMKKYIGLDIVVTPLGPQILEMNTDPCLYLLQMGLGVGVANLIE